VAGAAPRWILKDLEEQPGCVFFGIKNLNSFSIYDKIYYGKSKIKAVYVL
jgi:hypothetical protein